MGNASTSASGGTVPRAVARLAERLDWNLFPSGEMRLLLAVSGGADSVFLAHVFAAKARERKWTLILAHVHHGIRGEAADRDLERVESLARELGAEFVASRLEPSQIEPEAGEKSMSELRGGGSSLEGRLRLARWGVLAALARAHDCEAIVTGHNRDDLAETFLLQALRGAGLSGLGSLAPVGKWEDVAVIRPMMDIGRDEIRAALHADSISWREDETNLDRAFKRNWLRLEILPALEAYQKGGVANLARTAALCTEETLELQRAGRIFAGLAAPLGEPAEPCPAAPIHWGTLRSHPPVLRHHAFRVWLADTFAFPLMPSYDALLDLEHAAENARQSGGERFVVSIPGLLVWTDGDCILAGLSRDHAKVPRPALLERITPWLVAWRELWHLPVLFEPPAGCETEIGNYADSRPPAKSWRTKRFTEGLKGVLRVQFGAADSLPHLWLHEWHEEMDACSRAVLAISHVHGRLRVRPWTAEDRMPMHRGGRKEVSRALSEAHIPEALRPLVPAICDDDGPLLLVGVRRAKRAHLVGRSSDVLVIRAESA